MKSLQNTITEKLRIGKSIHAYNNEDKFGQGELCVFSDIKFDDILENISSQELTNILLPLKQFFDSNDELWHVKQESHDNKVPTDIIDQLTPQNSKLLYSNIITKSRTQRYGIYVKGINDPKTIVLMIKNLGLTNGCVHIKEKHLYFKLNETSK